MAKIFITGSADGLGLLAAKELINLGHEVLLHARNDARARTASDQAAGAIGVVIGDLSNMQQTIQLTDQVNAVGVFDAIIHNAGVYQGSSKDIFAVNSIVPYILTCLIQKPQRLIYLSSDMHMQGNFRTSDFTDVDHPINYSDSKLHVLMLSNAVARKWPVVYANAVNPGWVPTKMGGTGAPDNLEKGYATQVWLASCNDDEAKVSGKYFFHQKIARCNAQANDAKQQDQLLQLCGQISGITFPE